MVWQELGCSDAMAADANGGWEGLSSPAAPEPAATSSTPSAIDVPALLASQEGRPGSRTADHMSTAFARHGPVSDSPTGTVDSDAPSEPVPNGHQIGHVGMRKAASVDVFALHPGPGLPSTRSEDGERR